MTTTPLFSGRRRLVAVAALVLATGLATACQPAEGEVPAGSSASTATPVAPESPSTAPSTGPDTPPPASDPKPVGDIGSKKGISGCCINEDNPAPEIKAMADAGVKWLRIDLRMEAIQPTGPNDWDTARPDRLVDAANANGIKILAILDYAPAWANGGKNGRTKSQPAPDQMGAWTNFVGKAVTYYKAKGVRHWEVWNEPNHTNFWNPPNVDEYITVLKATYTKVKELDPGSLVVSGGLSPAEDKGGQISPRVFAQQLYDKGANKYFDAFGIHPYTFPAVPLRAGEESYFPTMSGQKDAWNTWQSMRAIRSLMVARGDGAKRIWLTEFGAPTAGPGSISEAALADLVRQSFAWVTGPDASYTGPIFWYQWRDKGTDPGDKELHFGLLRNDSSDKAGAMAAFKAAKA